MIQSNNMSKSLATIGLVGGMFYAFKNNKGFVGYASYGLLFGAMGYLVGNAIVNFYE